MAIELDSKVIVAHIEGRIAEAPIHEDPFPHLIIGDLIPNAAYQAILKLWPPEQVFAVNRSMQRNDVRLRRDLGDLPVSVQKFWMGVLTWTAAANRTIARRLAPYSRLKYEPFLGERWVEQVGKLPHIVGEAQLAYYTGKAELAPHIDHPKLATNAFVYCSERAEAEPELGTVLYAGRGFTMPDNAIMLQPALIPKLLRRVKVVPYQANLCLAYLNTPRSFHGVDSMDLGTRHRRLLMFGTMLREKDTIRLFGPEYASPESRK